jgi:hypothetical protein
MKRQTETVLCRDCVFWLCRPGHVLTFGFCLTTGPGEGGKGCKAGRRVEGGRAERAIREQEVPS